MQTFNVIELYGGRIHKIKGKTKQSALINALKKKPSWRGKVVLVLTREQFIKNKYTPFDMSDM